MVAARPTSRMHPPRPHQNTAAVPQRAPSPPPRHEARLVVANGGDGVGVDGGGGKRAAAPQWGDAGGGAASGAAPIAPAAAAAGDSQYPAVAARRTPRTHSPHPHQNTALAAAAVVAAVPQRAPSPLPSAARREPWCRSSGFKE